MLRYLTAGESHGPQLTAILEGMVAGLPIDRKKINHELWRRRQGYGRGKRMKIENDKIEILSGVRFGKTLGTPITVAIKNKDWKNWKKTMSVDLISAMEMKKVKKVTNIRPGHADYPGVLKYGVKDIRDILERASARETAMRTAVGAICRQFLSQFNIKIKSVIEIVGGYQTHGKITKRVKEVIDSVRKEGDTIGGIFRLLVQNAPVGLGSHTHWDKKLDARISRALISIQAIKGVEFGLGFSYAFFKGSEVHDQITIKNKKVTRLSNNAGGIEGGMTNGEDIDIRIALKPIATMKKQLQSINIFTKKKVKAHYERSDVSVVEAATVVAENVIATEITNAMLEKFGGDSLKETKTNYQNYIKTTK
ncbi:chorismate synthase [Candidatus Margulisiibacteriota bacterium]